MRAAFTLPGLALLLLAAGCKTEDTPSAWEIVRGTAQLTGSKSLTPDLDSVLADFSSRTGTLTVNEDSSVTGWIRLAAGDTAFVTGAIVNDGGLVMVLDSLPPNEYSVITDGDFPDTYGLISTSSVTGGDHPGLHLVYWEFGR